MFDTHRRLQPALFHDRVDAGRQLAREVQRLALLDAVVLAIPSGGVPVAAEIARVLGLPLDLLVARKIQFPWTTEAGFGAVVADGTVYLGPYADGLPREVVEAQAAKARSEVRQRTRDFLGDRAPVEVAGRDVILVDDGLASGSTMRAAVISVRKRKPSRIVVAVPTASAGAVRLLKPLAGQLVALYVHPEGLPFAAASSYERWHDLSDEEVKAYLRDSAWSAPDDRSRGSARSTGDKDSAR